MCIPPSRLSTKGRLRPAFFGVFPERRPHPRSRRFHVLRCVTWPLASSESKTKREDAAATTASRTRVFGKAHNAAYTATPACPGIEPVPTQILNFTGWYFTDDVRQ
ncbi:hypothetical protein Trydic_g14487 [Trypoxylus dichotomus]